LHGLVFGIVVDGPLSPCNNSSTRNARAASTGSGGIAVGIVLDYLFTHR
jgi:hypothetical protein